MSKAPQTPKWRAQRSPKEDGEVGETLGDILARHSSLSPGMVECVEALKQHNALISPQVASAITRLVSAALSPLGCKADPRDAKEALHSISTEMLPQRAAKVKRFKQRHAEKLAQLAREAAEAVERENEKRSKAVKRQREEVAARPTRSTRHIENSTRIVWS